MKFITSPVRKDEQARENADGKSHPDRGEALPSYIHNLVSSNSRYNYEVECEDEYHGAVLVSLLNPRNEPNI